MDRNLQYFTVVARHRADLLVGATLVVHALILSLLLSDWLRCDRLVQFLFTLRTTKVCKRSQVHEEEFVWLLTRDVVPEGHKVLGIERIKLLLNVSN